ncbi:MAG: hypothetical protein ABI600_04690 [Luteolibacter sp.]
MDNPNRIPNLVELKCKNCGSNLTPADFSPQLMAARCPHCQALFAITGTGDRAIARPEVALPKSFQIRRTPQSLDISRRWFGAHAFFLLLFAIVWNSFMVVWHTISLTQGLWFMSAFGLLHTCVGIFLIYYVLALFLNSTVVRANNQSLEVKSRPMPWKGDKLLANSEVEQLYCIEKISRGQNGSSASYRVEAVLRGNRRETLIGGLTDPDHALFIEQQLEHFLKISDTPVAGEYGR